MFFWAFLKLDIHKKICGDKFNAGLFLLGGLMMPWGIFM